ncbi:MAG: hypothetical protein G01um101429_1029 [Parcubacteria group bacterium Gr01-1014_29]|nr:MAG: hypothetical protein G01um101429_1029 [Parcubacteria group bacterium Gr01-1014_29]
MTTSFYLFLLGAVLLAGVGTGVLFVIQRARQYRRVSGSLHMALYAVLLPQELTVQEKDRKDPKDLISIMEQFYAGMVSREEIRTLGFLTERSSFTLEIALPSLGEEITFYVAVPRKWSRVFEKKVNALFPHARVEQIRDYNIFNEEGVTLGSTLRLKRSPFFPVRTYRHLEADPLEVITTAFSKLKKEGEGAALQLMVRPADSTWQEKGKEAARFMRKGKTARDINKGASWQTAATGVAREIVQGSKSAKQKEEEQKGAQGPFDEEMVKLLEEKAGRAGFDVNIRLLASASTREEALDVLQSLEDAFLQFSDPQSNGFVIERREGRSLEELVYQFSFRLFDEKHTVYLSTEELTSMYHFPVGALSAPKVKFLRAREAPPPANLPEEGLILGENVFRNDRSLIRMQRDDRRRHMYIIGQTGTGKTNFMKSLIHQDIMNGEGVCFIDPHGETVEELLELIPRERVEDIIYFNPGDVARPLGLNMLEYDLNFPEQKTFVVNELFSIFQKLYGAVPESMGPMFEQYFRNATLLVMGDPASGNTLLEIERVLADKDFRAYKLAHTNNIVVRTFWEDVAEKAGGEAALQNIVPYITSKFDIFLANEIMRPIIGQEKSAFNFREVMDNKKILFVNLSKGRLGDINSYLLGLIIVGKLLMAALSRGELPQQDRKDFYLYIDEFQNVTTKSIETILSEARKYRLNLIMAHQFIGQLEEGIKKAAFGNVGSMVSFRIGADDAEFVEQQFEPVFGAHDLMNIDNYNAYVKLLINGQTSRPFNIRSFAVPQGNKMVAEAVKELSSMKYGVPREEVEQKIEARFKE